MSYPKRALGAPFISALVLSAAISVQADEHEAKAAEATEPMPEIVVVAEKIEDRSQSLIASADTRRTVQGAVLEELSERLRPEQASVE